MKSVYKANTPYEIRLKNVKVGGENKKLAYITRNAHKVLTRF